ncbi:immune-associated nucleotide-binding protein 5-like isoform X1 [Sebastes umbrosus]|uniref:immune-associated nucleotide-binding protein 5-like isoform X1 n=1 Tax=Sebastes umbrosus TaxID=72105 RepID=UPI00189EE2A5|nr:immune-associated nucleotide-binding protein 5-like isoform X1 [Sebastes umbrosus]
MDNMECQCANNPEDGGWWMSSQMGAFTVVGYLLYRFSQTLPRLIRWPIRLFCSLTGLTALWSWVGRLVGTLRGIQSLCKWLSRVWRFVGASSSKFKWLIAIITGSSSDGALEDLKSSTNKPSLRLILVGPTGGGRTSLADTLLGKSETPMDPQMESTKRRTIMGGREVIVIDTPDLLGLSLGNHKKAREALRSLQLSGPGPHAFLLVIRAPGSSMTIDQDAAQAVRATLKLFGDGVAGYIIPVLTHPDRLGRRPTVDALLDADSGGLKRALSLCDQRPELLDNGPDRPLEAQIAMRKLLVERVMETEAVRGHFVHELQRREDHIREELLADMGSALAGKL